MFCTFVAFIVSCSYEICVWLVVYIFHMFVDFLVHIPHVYDFPCTSFTNLCFLHVPHVWRLPCKHITFSARLEDFWYTFYTCLLIFVHFPHVRGLSCEIYLFVHVSHVYGLLVLVLHVHVYILLMVRAFVFVDCSERFRLSSIK